MATWSDVSPPCRRRATLKHALLQGIDFRSIIGAEALSNLPRRTTDRE